MCGVRMATDPDASSVLLQAMTEIREKHCNKEDARLSGYCCGMSHRYRSTQVVVEAGVTGRSGARSWRPPAGDLAEAG